MRRGELAERREGPRALLGQRAAEGLGEPERGLTADAVGVEAREIRLGLPEREPEGVDDEPAFVARVASTRRRPP
jgi:hypothetical protein